jgi:hypothetical protein
VKCSNADGKIYKDLHLNYTLGISRNVCWDCGGVRHCLVLNKTEICQKNLNQLTKIVYADVLRGSTFISCIQREKVTMVRAIVTVGPQRHKDM